MKTDEVDPFAMHAVPRQRHFGGVDPGPAGDQFLGGASRLWSRITETRYRFLRAALGARGPALDWLQYQLWLVSVGIADPPGADGSLRVREPLSEGETAEAAAAVLLDHWLIERDAELAVDALCWARIRQDWTRMAEIWSAMIPAASWREPQVLAMLAELPEQARREAPMLTVAWALAQADGLGHTAWERQVSRGLLADGLSLHAYWRDLADPSAALLGAALWMSTQRIVPGVSSAAALELAWAAHDDAARMIEGQRGSEAAPSRRAEAIFRAASAQVALARGELEQCVAEAERAAALDPAASAWICDGTGALAKELTGVAGEGSAQHPGELVQLAHQRGLLAEDSTAGFVADALRSLRRLDRPAVDDALQAFSKMTPGGAMWTFAVYLKAMHGALWGEPAKSLAALDAAKTSHSLSSAEQNEPLGSLLLARARIALLDRLGADAAALEAAHGLDSRWRWLPEARSLLWAGRYDAARRAADCGIFAEGTRLGDRVGLRAVRAGALLLDPATDQEVAIEAVLEAVAECVEHQTLMPLGMLPASVRSAMLAAFRAHRRSQLDRASVDSFLAALDGLVPVGEVVTAPVRLTRREKELLPLLAGADAIPEIAARLQVSPHTVRKQVVNLRRKFGAKSRSELIRQARDQGMV